MASTTSTKKRSDEEMEGGADEKGSESDETWTSPDAVESGGEDVTVSLPRQILHHPAIQEAADRFRMSNNQV